MSTYLGPTLISGSNTVVGLPSYVNSTGNTITDGDFINPAAVIGDTTVTLFGTIGQAIAVGDTFTFSGTTYTITAVAGDNGRDLTFTPPLTAAVPGSSVDGELLFTQERPYLQFEVGRGISLGGNTDNVLDDYEEGIWTPGTTNLTNTDGTSGFSAAAGAYTKIGNLVALTGEITIPANSDTSAIFINGAPFTNVGDAAILMTVQAGSINANTEQIIPLRWQFGLITAPLSTHTWNQISGTRYEISSTYKTDA